MLHENADYTIYTCMSFYLWIYTGYTALQWQIACKMISNTCLHNSCNSLLLIFSSNEAIIYTPFSSRVSYLLIKIARKLFFMVLKETLTRSSSISFLKLQQVFYSIKPKKKLFFDLSLNVTEFYDTSISHFPIYWFELVSVVVGSVDMTRYAYTWLFCKKSCLALKKLIVINVETRVSLLEKNCKSYFAWIKCKNRNKTEYGRFDTRICNVRETRMF